MKSNPKLSECLHEEPEGNALHVPLTLCRFASDEGEEQILDEPVMEYHAGENRVGRYVIRSCIGGLDSAFVASGSEVSRSLLLTLLVLQTDWASADALSLQPAR